MYWDMRVFFFLTITKIQKKKPVPIVSTGKCKWNLSPMSSLFWGCKLVLQGDWVNFVWDQYLHPPTHSWDRRWAKIYTRIIVEPVKRSHTRQYLHLHVVSFCLQCTDNVSLAIVKKRNKKGLEIGVGGQNSFTFSLV